MVPISDAQAEVARGVTKQLKAAGIRARLDAKYFIVRRVLAGARVFGRSTRFAYLEAGDLHQNAHGWVSEMRPGCMMVPAEARGDGPAATAC